VGDAQAQQPTEDAGGEDHHRERHLEHRQGDEGRNGQGHQQRVVQGPSAHPVHGLDDDGDDRRGEAGEQAGHHGRGAGADVQR
jgi:hypothetical protein